MFRRPLREEGRTAQTGGELLSGTQVPFATMGRVESMDKSGLNEKASGARTKRIFALGVVIFCLVVLFAAVWIKRNVYASKFTPVDLSKQEQRVLETKLSRLQERKPKAQPQPGKTLAPDPYTEEGATREIHLTERELNGLIANTPDIAEMVAVDLSNDLISVKLVLPVEEEVPVLGGKTLKIHMGLTVTYEGGRPIIALKGVSLGGIPLPNAWLGNLKNVNLVGEFGADDGFWEIFSSGVQSIKVQQGHVEIKLKE